MTDISVYKILNKVTGLFYIGYSQSTKKRFQNHINMLKRNEHHCIHLQRSWNMHGQDAFEFSRLVVFGRIEDAIAEEQRQFDLHFKKGALYNSVGSNDPTVFVRMTHTKEAIRKGSESKKNSEKFLSALAQNRKKAHTPDAIKKRVESWKRGGQKGMVCTSVIARKETDNSVCVYKSIQEAARALNVSAGNIHGCCTGKRPMVNGYLFSYELPWLDWRSDMENLEMLHTSVS